LKATIASYHQIIDSFDSFIRKREFPCIAAKAAAARQNIRCLIIHDMTDSKEDKNILQFIYDFIDEYRSVNKIYHSAAIIFEGPDMSREECFDGLMWQKLQSLANLDAEKYPYDKRVNADPSSPHFSFSLKEEAFFIIGLHPGSSRPARRFSYPALVFNPHDQFEKLREEGRYEAMKKVVRNRDLQFSGSVNPMLHDFATSSEALQYSGKVYAENWKCPLQIKHGKS
jgi:FPC/CPF motif-containing protein YcgG